MNQKNFTQKSQEALQSAQTLSLEYGNPQIEQAQPLIYIAGSGKRPDPPSWSPASVQTRRA